MISALGALGSAASFLAATPINEIMIETTSSGISDQLRDTIHVNILSMHNYALIVYLRG